MTCGLILPAIIAATAWGQTITRLSVHRDGTEAYSTPFYLGAALMDASSDGRFALYRTSQTDIVPAAHSGMNLLLLDRQSGTTVLVAHGFIRSAAVSDDGASVAFIGREWIQPNGVPAHDQAYRITIAGRIVVPISLSAEGEYANDHCRKVAISGDGHTIAFLSLASNLGASVPQGEAYGYVYTPSSPTVTPVTQHPSGYTTYVDVLSDAEEIEVSPDGDRIIFTFVRYLTPDGERGDGQIMLVDLASGTVTIPTALDRIVAHCRPTFCDDGIHLMLFRLGTRYDERYILRFDTTQGIIRNITNAGDWAWALEPNFDGSEVVAVLSGSLAFIDVVQGGGPQPIGSPTDDSTLLVSEGSPVVIRANSDLSQILFTSDLSTLVENDSNNASDLFVLDRSADPPHCFGDANGDRRVSMADIQAVLRDWSLSQTPGDANGDGTVNFEDIWFVLSWWGNNCPPRFE